MPRYTLMIERANELFRTDNIQSAPPPLTSNLLTYLAKLNIARTPDEKAVVGKMPTWMQQGLLDLIKDNKAKTTPYGMQFVWRESTQWDFDPEEQAPVTADGVGSISVIIYTPMDPLGS